MIDLGLTPTEQEAYERTLRRSHAIRIRVNIRDRDEELVGPLAGRIAGGSVTIDAEAEVTRSLSLTIVEDEASERYAFVPNSPAEGGIFADNFVNVLRGVYVPELVRWVDVPIFWGPITQLERTGNEVTLEAQGKEALQRDPYVTWETVNIPRGTYLTDAIRALLARNGEARYQLGPPKRRLRAPIVLPRMGEPWIAALSVAESVNRHLFYDGHGHVRYRGYPRNRMWAFERGDGGTVMSEPQVTFATERVRNVVEVLGPEPDGRGARVRAVAEAPRRHPLSAWSLRRNGKPRYLVEHVEDTEIMRTDEAQEIADRTLEDLLRIEVSAAFDSLVIPHLEENDLVALHDGGRWVEFRLKQFSIPLTSEGLMSVGFLTKPPKLNRRRVRA